MRRRDVLCGFASATIVSIAGCQEPEFGNEDPLTQDDYGTVRCGLDGDRTTEPAETSTIDGLDGTWPTTYFDERLTAYNPDANPPRDCPQTQWRSQIEVQFEQPDAGMFTIYGSPAIGEGTCYVHDNENELYAYDSHSGEEAWRLRTGRERTRGVTLQDDTLYLSQNGGLRAVNLDAREERWFATASPEEIRTSGVYPVGAPTVDSETVCLGTEQGILRAYDASTGRVRWRFDIAEQPGITQQSLTDEEADYQAYARSHPPAIVDDLVVAPFVVGDVFALDRATGEVAWRLRLDEHINPNGGLAVHGDACFLATGTDLVRIDLADGTVEWRLTERWTGDSRAGGEDDNSDEPAVLYVASSPAVTPPDDGDQYSSPTVFVDVGSSWTAARLHALDAETGAVRWNAPVATGWMNDVCVGGDVVFVSTGEYLVALDRVTGSVLYGVKQYPTRGTVALVDGAIIAGDIYGHVYAVA